VVILDDDLSDRGVPSVQLYSNAHIAKVFEHLQRLGHTRIDCISSHVHNLVIENRIRLWRDWTYRHGNAGELWEQAAPSFSDPTPYAYAEMCRLIKRGPLRATAFVGTTFPAAVGAIRACLENKLVVGRDVSICAMNLEWPAHFMTPTVTGLEMPDISGLLNNCFEWFASDRPWDGPKLLQPARCPLFEGESTGPVKQPRN
jgi:DNA-binding LacI/PurR family transcriptional regulator